jgi:hypothetical protein
MAGQNIRDWNVRSVRPCRSRWRLRKTLPQTDRRPAAALGLPDGQVGESPAGKRQICGYRGSVSMSTVPSWQISLTICTNLLPRFHIFMFAWQLSYAQ